MMTHGWPCRPPSALLHISGCHLFCSGVMGVRALPLVAVPHQSPLWRHNVRQLLKMAVYVCRRLAPIRGIPTKGGNLSDPNSDLKEIFDTFESLPSAPIKLAQGLMSWARGEQDPDWKPKGKKGNRQ
jgi:hypothetical protein